MAERRMFAKALVDSDHFLDMSLSAQALYFHLGMRADDDGFVNNPRKIQRMIGAPDDDLKILIAKGYVITFESGIIVIRHWKQHNYIPSDRYKPTLYDAEKSSLQLDASKAYISVSDVDTTCIQPVYDMDTQDRLGKDRLGKDRLIPPISPKGGEPRRIHKDDKKKAEELFERFWKEYPRKAAKQNAHKAWDKLNPDEALTEQIIASVERFRLDPQWTKDNGQFIPHAATFLNGKRWEDETEVQMNAINRRSEPEWDDGLDEEGREAIRLACARDRNGF